LELSVRGAESKIRPTDSSKYMSNAELIRLHGRVPFRWHLGLMLNAWLFVSLVYSNAAQVPAVAPREEGLQRTSIQPATVRPFHQAALYAKATGFLKQLNVDIGDKVRAGDTLATLDLPELESAVQRQTAQVLLA